MKKQGLTLKIGTSIFIILILINRFTGINIPDWVQKSLVALCVVLVIIDLCARWVCCRLEAWPIIGRFARKSK